MTNEQIIQEIAIQVYGAERVDEFLRNGEIPLHTAQGWYSRGCKIKKDEHGVACKLWKKKEKKKEKSELGEEKTEIREFYLCKSYLFRADQVEYMEEKKK